MENVYQQNTEKEDTRINKELIAKTQNNQQKNKNATTTATSNKKRKPFCKKKSF